MAFVVVDVDLKVKARVDVHRTLEHLRQAPIFDRHLLSRADRDEFL
jgi:hypothetical protein